MESGTYTEMKAAALEKATNEGWFDRPHPNDDTDSLIFITKDSFTHSFSNLTKDFGEDTIRCMAHIPQIIKNSILTKIDPPKNERKMETRVYTFLGAINGVNGVQAVKLTVKEFNFTDMNHLKDNIRAYFEKNGIVTPYDSLYDARALEIVDIEGINKEPDASGKVGGNNPRARATSDSTISVADLLSLVKGDAEKYLPKSQKNDISVQGGTQLSLSTDTESRKQKQFTIIQKTNPAPNSYNTWIRSVNDIKTLAETLQDSDYDGYDEFNPDLTRADIEKAIESGTITVYSSYPIKNGAFVTPSKMEAQSYSGNGQVYLKIRFTHSNLNFPIQISFQLYQKTLYKTNKVWYNNMLPRDIWGG